MTDKITINHSNSLFEKVVANKKLSLKAKGLFMFMATFPADFVFSLGWLENNLKEGRDSIRLAMDELCKFNVATFEKKRTAEGTFTSKFTINQTNDGQAI